MPTTFLLVDQGSPIFFA